MSGQERYCAFLRFLCHFFVVDGCGHLDLPPKMCVRASGTPELTDTLHIFGLHMRTQALRQASSHWQRGKFGGEVAFFYAEEVSFICLI